MRLGTKKAIKAAISVNMIDPKTRIKAHNAALNSILYIYPPLRCYLHYIM